MIAIPESDTMVITGGSWGGNPLDYVSEYSEAGWREELPVLNTARHRHGCSSYVMDDGKRVNTDI